jgi:hypothetical protein
MKGMEPVKPMKKTVQGESFLLFFGLRKPSPWTVFYFMSSIGFTAFMS